MHATELATEDIRQVLRESLRGFLSEHWDADCVKQGPSPDDVSAIWTKLVGQGIASLGASCDEGGLSEILVVLEEWLARNNVSA